MLIEEMLLGNGTSKEAADRSFFYFIIPGVVSAMIIGANLINIFVIRRLKKTRCSTRILYSWMSVSDLCVGFCACFFVRPAYLGEWIYPDWWCSVTGYLITVSATVSVYLMAALSIERCIIISRPFDYRRFVRKRNVVVGCVVVSVCSFGFAGWLFHSRVGNLYRFHIGSFTCAVAYSLNLSTAISGFILVIITSGLIISVCWIVIFANARIHQRKVTKMTQRKRTTSSETTKSSTREHPRRVNPIRKQLRTIFLMTFGFYIAWIPYTSRQIHLALTGQSESVWPDFLFDWLAISNSCWNTLIYCLTDMEYKSTLINVLTSWKQSLSCCKNDTAEEEDIKIKNYKQHQLSIVRTHHQEPVQTKF